MIQNLQTEHGKLNSHIFLLRALPFGDREQYSFPLSRTEPTVVGRRPDCQIVVGHLYYGTSQRHFAIYPIAASDASDIPVWKICDSSVDGTYINEKMIHHECQLLQVGDRIRVGKDGPEFILEMQSEYTNIPVK